MVKFLYEGSTSAFILLLRLYLNVYNREETGCGASKTNTDVHQKQLPTVKLNTYFWLFTEASKKCDLPSLYCFLCDLTFTPLLFRTTAPFSREILNSSDWSKIKNFQARQRCFNIAKAFVLHLKMHVLTCSKHVCTCRCVYPFIVVEQESAGLQCSEVESTLKVVKRWNLCCGTEVTLSREISFARHLSRRKHISVT